MLDEWSGDDVDELFELLDAQLGDIGVDVKFDKKSAAVADEPAEGEDESVEDYEDDDEDEDDDDLDDDDEEEEEADEP
jgi:hypothetical protein